MKRIKKTVAVIVSFIFSICWLSMNIYAAEDVWDIENILDVSECKQGDTIIMSVKLKGSNDSVTQQIISIEGTLEYDSSLFMAEKSDILPVESGNVQSCSFDPATGGFSVKYLSDLVVQDSDLMLQIRLHTAKDASVGKTTLCITQMKWSSLADQQTVEIEHRVPVRITILEAEMPIEAAGDVNQDGKVNLADAKLVMQYYNRERSFEDQEKRNADVNGDEKVNLTDAKLIMKYYNGEITEF